MSDNDGSRIDAGRLFQTRGPLTANDRSPNVVLVGFKQLREGDRGRRGGEGRNGRGEGMKKRGRRNLAPWSFLKVGAYGHDVMEKVAAAIPMQYKSNYVSDMSDGIHENNVRGTLDQYDTKTLMYIVHRIFGQYVLDASY